MLESHGQFFRMPLASPPNLSKMSKNIMTRSEKGPDLPGCRESPGSGGVRAKLVPAGGWCCLGSRERPSPCVCVCVCVCAPMQLFVLRGQVGSQKSGCL